MIILDSGAIESLTLSEKSEKPTQPINFVDVMFMDKESNHLRDAERPGTFQMHDSDKCRPETMEAWVNCDSIKSGRPTPTYRELAEAQKGAWVMQLPFESWKRIAES